MLLRQQHLQIALTQIRLQGLKFCCGPIVNVQLQQLRNHLRFKPRFKLFGRRTRHHTIRRYIFGHHAVGGDDGSLSNTYPRHDHGPHAYPCAIANVRVALAHISRFYGVHEWIQAEPIGAVGVIATHQNHRFSAYAHIITNVQLVYLPQRLPFEAFLIAIQIAHNRLLKPIVPCITVITVLTFDDDVGIAHGLMQVFHPRPMFALLHVLCFQIHL